MKSRKQLGISSIIAICVIESIFFSVKGAETQKKITNIDKVIDSSYLNSRKPLEDYILDTGDELNIEFVNTPDLSGSFLIDAQGEIYLRRIKYTFVRGLTINELTKLLEERYKEFLVNPHIYIRIKRFKPFRVSVRGEVRTPGILKLPAYTSSNIRTSLNVLENIQSELETDINSSKNYTNSSSLALSNNKNSNSLNSKAVIKRDNEYITTLSNAIQRAGGLTSHSDISKIAITRDIPLGKGGGKKRAIVNFRSYIQKADSSSDMRLFDGDDIFIPRLKEKDISIIPKSILSGLSPRFINVSISGQVENPGTVKIPTEGSLSDVMNLTGPRKPLSGRIYLIRYNQDGSLIRKKINYYNKANVGSPRNPYLVAGDLITVKNSILGRATGTIKAISEPFLGIYATKELIENISGQEL